MGLVLPSLYSELEGPALAHIVEVLSRVPYLSQIVIGLDRADQEQYAHALHYFSRLPQHHRVLWNDGPRLKAIDEQLQTLGLAPRELGKGRNVWYCFGYVQATGLVDAVALHDCDILTYDRALLARASYTPSCTQGSSTTSARGTTPGSPRESLGGGSVAYS